MAKSGKLLDVEQYRAQVYAREEESTTGIGEGIAIPHGKCDAVKTPGLAAMVIKNGVDYDSLDGEPVTLLFLIAAPNTKDLSLIHICSDGETHQGIFDYTYLSGIPNMHICAPKNKWELSDMMKFAVALEAPIAVRYPRGTAYAGLSEYRAPVSYTHLAIR